jgi:hypothetical protein
MDPGEYLSNLENMDLQAITERAIDKTLDRIADRNREQLYQGFTPTGGRLAPYRRRKYAAIKNEMNPLPGFGNPDFYLTGAFHRQIQAERVGDIVGVHSYDSKAPKLEDRDGADNIYGMGEEHHNEYVREDLSPVYYQEIAESLKGHP